MALPLPLLCGIGAHHPVESELLKFIIMIQVLRALEPEISKVDPHKPSFSFEARIWGLP